MRPVRRRRQKTINVARICEPERYTALMNEPQTPIAGGEAVLHFLDADFEVVRPGTYVSCAVTGARILLQDLRYWSVSRQEAFADAEAATAAFIKAQENGEAF